MSLKIWLPLNGNIENQGLADVTITNNGATVDNNGKIGKCYSFNGSSNYVQLTNSIIEGKKPFTFSVWYKTTSGNSYYPIISVGTSSKGFTIHGSVNRLEGGNGTNHFDSSNHITEVSWGMWAHLAVTYDGTKIQSYLNGAPNANSLFWTYGFGTGNTTIKIGHFWGGYFKGYINDFRIYDECLSPKEVKEIAKGLVLHYPLNDAYVEGTNNLFSANLTYHTNWNNSGSATWNWDDTTIPKINNSIIYSISRTDTGNSAIGCGRCNLVAGKTYTASVYVYLSGNTDSNKFFIRSVDTTVAVLKYNNDTIPQKWPQNQWIRATVTFTTSVAYNNCYLCTYLNYANSKRALTCWQIEEKDHATPYTPNTRNETTVYDCSGYQNNGTITGALSCSTDSPRYKISTHFTSSIPSRIMLPSDMSCLSGNNEQTLSCWVKSSGLGSGMSSSGLISLGYGNTLYLDSWNCCYIIDNGSDLNSLYANQNPHDGKWHLVTATYKSGVASIYVDGVLKNSVSRTFSNRYINAGLNCIGTETNDVDFHNINGDISDVRMYATALSAEDIKELYNTSAYVLDNGTLLTYSVEE